MKTKTIISTVLLLFVAGSTTYMVINEVRSGSQVQIAKSGESLTLPAGSKVVLYYFHGNERCQTCIKFESFTEEAIKGAFAEQVNSGELVWKMVNTDEPANKHFVGDYELYSKSIVVVENRDGKRGKWKNLEKIWELVGDKNTFVKYIKDEVGTYLGAS
ncbi:MAG: hypothetical protein GY774_34040 [Planctomycetes bacterium]|nr:hypothetical protein [Planctomycetota bacterium]